MLHGIPGVPRPDCGRNGDRTADRTSGSGGSGSGSGSGGAPAPDPTNLRLNDSDVVGLSEVAAGSAAEAIGVIAKGSVNRTVSFGLMVGGFDWLCWLGLIVWV
jgi:hypothetical protein